ncbi:MAG: hypothetical protein H8E26_15725 [FCB group bacterium]|nr:hypothetical protein [FCB group bacterium]MBL7028383.1 hypothetical protein [Candidatus Neomarinimicrobiota bacterium]MBL7121272.1 hypothetical protein [Candidatus Neomarinimicrobiota bacterium]
MREKLWGLIKYIFAKPYLLSLLVGFGLHFIMQISSWVFMDVDHFSYMLHDLIVNPVSGSIKIVVPFTLPLLMTRISRAIIDEREASILKVFPSLNPQPVLEIDFKHRITYVNPAAERLLDKNLTDAENINRLLGSNFVKHPVDHESQFPPRIVNVDEKVLLWNGNMNPDTQQFHLFATDITSLKQAELELIQAREIAEKANHLKTVFIDNISHEVRTPLTSIIGYAQLLELRLEQHLGEEERGYIDLIYKGSDRLKHTLDEIVDISSIESGLYLKESGEHHLEQLLQDVCSRFETAAQEKLLAFKVDINIDSDLVELDANAVSKALYNLIDNAVKYTDKGGIWISLNNAPGLILLDIRDTGIGISYEFRERLYEPFSQGSEGFTKDFQGIGLGLALAKRYLDINHIGLELLDSKPGGSIFRLKIPLKTVTSQRESRILTKQPMKSVSNGSSSHHGILL